MKFKSQKTPKVELYTKDLKKSYTNFLKKNKNSTFFHTIEWKENLQNFFPIKPYYLICKNNDDKIKAILPLFYTKSRLGPRLESIPCSIYGGCIGPEEYIKPLIDKTFELYKKLKSKHIVIKQYPLNKKTVLKDKGIEPIKRTYCQYIKLKNPKLLWKEIKKSNRNSIRNAKRNNIKIEKIKNSKHIKDFYRLERITKKSYGSTVLPKEFYKALWTKYHNKGYVDIFVAKHNSRVIASNMIFKFNKKMYYTYANSDPEKLHLRPNNLLLWEVIKHGYQNDFLYLDLGATPIKNKGLFHFKASFNSSYVDYPFYYYPKNTVIAKETILGKIANKILKISPLPIYRKLNNYLIDKYF